MTDPREGKLLNIKAIQECLSEAGFHIGLKAAMDLVESDVITHTRGRKPVKCRDCYRVLGYTSDDMLNYSTWCIACTRGWE